MAATIRSDAGPSSRVEATAVSPDGRTLAIARSEGPGPRSRPRRAAGCSHGKIAPADARSAPRDLRRGLQPRLEVAPDLGSRARNGPALGRGHLATLSPPLSVPRFPHPPGRLQPRRPRSCCWLPGW